MFDFFSMYILEVAKFGKTSIMLKGFDVSSICKTIYISLEGQLLYR